MEQLCCNAAGNTMQITSWIFLSVSEAYSTSTTQDDVNLTKQILHSLGSPCHSFTRKNVVFLQLNFFNLQNIIISVV